MKARWGKLAPAKLSSRGEFPKTAQSHFHALIQSLSPVFQKRKNVGSADDGRSNRVLLPPEKKLSTHLNRRPGKVGRKTQKRSPPVPKRCRKNYNGFPWLSALKLPQNKKRI